ncbi:hypothetical protein [Undibacterium flavidum]|uniref:Uncharacterized protein n=1 Tax=Undibacterium flavidum TaxID=2762297 RepID=A0ABR6YDH1_9BURK|nr:hypothetical protein [Undibacterium flavidum]MBC3874605.1 hypothetical protein [Undibacterium flavidum]
MFKLDFCAIDAVITKQTIEESIIEYSIDMGAFVIHHGTRDKRPIIIAEHKNQREDELSGVWYSES